MVEKVRRSEQILVGPYANGNSSWKLKGEALASICEAAGIDERFAYGHGPGMMRGYGWGRGGHMMGW